MRANADVVIVCGDINADDPCLGEIRNSFPDGAGGPRESRVTWPPSTNRYIKDKCDSEAMADYIWYKEVAKAQERGVAPGPPDVVVSDHYGVRCSFDVGRGRGKPDFAIAGGGWSGKNRDRQNGGVSEDAELGTFPFMTTKGNL